MKTHIKNHPHKTTLPNNIQRNVYCASANTKASSWVVLERVQVRESGWRANIFVCQVLSNCAWTWNLISMSPGSPSAASVKTLQLPCNAHGSRPSSFKETSQRLHHTATNTTDWWTLRGSKRMCIPELEVRDNLAAAERPPQGSWPPSLSKRQSTNKSNYQAIYWNTKQTCSAANAEIMLCRAAKKSWKLRENDALTLETHNMMQRKARKTLMQMRNMWNFKTKINWYLLPDTQTDCDRNTAATREQLHMWWRIRWIQ